MVVLALCRIRFLSLQLKLSRADKSTYMSQYPHEVLLSPIFPNQSSILLGVSPMGREAEACGFGLKV